MSLTLTELTESADVLTLQGLSTQSPMDISLPMVFARAMDGTPWTYIGERTNKKTYRFEKGIAKLNDSCIGLHSLHQFFTDIAGKLIQIYDDDEDETTTGYVLTSTLSIVEHPNDVFEVDFEFEEANNEINQPEY